MSVPPLLWAGSLHASIVISGDAGEGGSLRLRWIAGGGGERMDRLPSTLVSNEAPKYRSSFRVRRRRMDRCWEVRGGTRDWSDGGGGS